MRRATAAVAFLVVFGAAGCGGEEAPPPPPPEPTRLAIIFPEGFTIEEMAERVKAVRKIAIAKRAVTPRLTAKAYRAAVTDAQAPPRFRQDAPVGKLEGFLFPALYEFAPETTARELVGKQLDAFRERFAQLDLTYARSKHLTPYDVLVIASMVEEETAVAAERRLVAAVIYNRLRIGMPLGIDATIRYGLGIPGTQSLTGAALATDSPYNTRLRTGLPPTPIANPGLASLQAAAHPARDVDYVFYVRKPESLTHFFTASEREFLLKVCEYGYACD
ncbi:MAG: endolytic transglycosylase MltG [Thermoleophilia bacterium]|nr:endolytic transglycosylase MltG [Thermoleophilia bacterium]